SHSRSAISTPSACCCGSSAVRAARTATPCCRRSCSNCCAPGGGRAGGSACCCRKAGCFQAAIRSSHSRPASSTAPFMPQPRPPGSRSGCRRIRCGTALLRTCWNKTPIFASSRCCSKQRHTAGCPAIEVRILYPFHPRSGETVAVVGARRHAGIAHFIIRQPDLTLALLPAWMTEASRRAQAVVVQPRLSVERLADLRALVDALMASCIGDPPPCNGASNVERATPSERLIRREAAGGGASARPAEQIGAIAADPPGGGGRRPAAPSR